MRVRRIGLGPLETNCWIVTESEGTPAVVIDPGGDVQALLHELAGGAVDAIVLTHGHFDHLGAVTELIEATGAPLLVHEEDADRLTHDGAEGTGGAPFGFAGVVAPAADRTLAHADVIEAGGLCFKVLHTPGHTPGGICLLVSDPSTGVPHLFSGDTLFAGSVGRTDFPGGDGRALSNSIATELASLPPETLVHPGHGPDTTIQRESRINPFWPRA
jgi:glyoxylase-like metal-dependent hydrolase (beta-lactamase superfamily II)